MDNWDREGTESYRDGPQFVEKVSASLAELASAGDSCAGFAYHVLSNPASVPPMLNVADAECQADPQTRSQAMHSPLEVKWLHAEADKLQSLHINGVYEECELPPGRKAIGTKWVYKTKRDGKRIVRYKARLVAKGYTQVAGVDFTHTFSPVARFASIRLLLALSAVYGLHLHAMDVETAFLNAELKEEIYCKLPPGYEKPKTVWRLKKSLYGLKQSPREWNHNIDAYLRCCKFKVLDADPCIYTRTDALGLAYVALYVDDLILACQSEASVAGIKRELRDKYMMTDLGPIDKVFDLRVKQSANRRTVTVSQSDYVDAMLDRFNMTAVNPASTPMDYGSQLSVTDCPTTEEGRRFTRDLDYRAAVGSLLWLANGTRPDISFAVSQVSRFLENPGEPHYLAVKRILRYLKGTKDLGIKYSIDDATQQKDLSGYFSYVQPEQGETIPLLGYVDSDYATCKDTRRSVTGYVVYLASGPVTWGSRKQTSVTLSSTEAEFMAACAAAQESIWLVRMLTELGQVVPKPLVLFEDNQSCIYLANSETNHIKELSTLTYVRSSYRDRFAQESWSSRR
jgi:hypothetical protein